MRKLIVALSMLLAAGCLETTEMVSDAGTETDARVDLDASEWDPSIPDASQAQGNYAYPGCADETHTCPYDATYLCAKAAIARRHAACGVATDCVHVELGDDPITGCPPIVINAADEADFRAEMQDEIDRYVEVNTNCRSSGQCVGGGAAACVNGYCAWVSSPADAGF